MFDTSIMHSAKNEAASTRVVLLTRVWHPEVSEEEREALRFCFDAMDYRGLLSDDVGERFMAEMMVKSMRDR